MNKSNRLSRMKRRLDICQMGCFPVYCQHHGRARECPVYKKLKSKGILSESASMPTSADDAYFDINDYTLKRLKGKLK